MLNVIGFIVHGSFVLDCEATSNMHEEETYSCKTCICINFASLDMDDR